LIVSTVSVSTSPSTTIVVLVEPLTSTSVSVFSAPSGASSGLKFSVLSSAFGFLESVLISSVPFSSGLNPSASVASSTLPYLTLSNIVFCSDN